MPSKTTIPGPFGPVWENDEGRPMGRAPVDWRDQATEPLQRVPMQRTWLWVLGTLALVVAAGALAIYGPFLVERPALGVTPALPSKEPAWQPEQPWVDARVQAWLRPPPPTPPAVRPEPAAPAPAGPGAPERERRPSSSPSLTDPGQDLDLDRGQRERDRPPFGEPKREGFDFGSPGSSLPPEEPPVDSDDLRPAPGFGGDLPGDLPGSPPSSPEGNRFQEDAGIPDADLPDGDVPDADFPDADVPDGDLPDADFPDDDVPGEERDPSGPREPDVGF